MNASSDQRRPNRRSQPVAPRSRGVAESSALPTRGALPPLAPPTWAAPQCAGPPPRGDTQNSALPPLVAHLANGGFLAYNNRSPSSAAGVPPPPHRPLPSPAPPHRPLLAPAPPQQSAFAREQEKKEARMNRERNVYIQQEETADVFPAFLTVKKNEEEDGEALTDKIIHSLGKFKTFYSEDRPELADYDLVGNLPARIPIRPDKYDIIPRRTTPPPQVSGNNRTGPSFVGGSHEGNSEPRVRSTSARHAPYNTATNGRQQPAHVPHAVAGPSGGGSNGRLRPEQLSEARARKVTHKESAGALTSNSRVSSPIRQSSRHSSPIRLTQNAGLHRNEMTPVRLTLPSTDPQLSPITAKRINSMALHSTSQRQLEFVHHGFTEQMITPMSKTPSTSSMRKRVRGNRERSRTPSPAAPVMPPMPHVPPPPQSARSRQPGFRALEYDGPSADDLTIDLSNNSGANISAICAAYPSQMNLSEDSEEEEGEIRESPRASSSSVARPPTSAQQSPPLPQENAANQDDDGSTSDSATSTSETTSTSSDDLQKNEDARRGWSLTKLFAPDEKATVESPNNDPPAVQPVAANVAPANSNSCERNHNQERVAGSSQQKSLRKNSSRNMPSSDESSDDEAPTTRPTPQITAVPRPAERSRLAYSSDSDDETANARPSTSHGKKDNRKNAAIAKRQTGAVLKKKAAVSEVTAATLPPTPKKPKGKRGRPRKVVAANVNASKIRSKPFVSSDDDSDSDMESKTRRNVPQTGRGKVSSNKRNPLRRSPRQASPLRAPIQTESFVKPTTTTNKKVDANPIEAGKTKANTGDCAPLLPPMDFDFSPFSFKTLAREVKKTPVTSDKSKKNALVRVYGKSSKDHNQNDSSSSKGRDSVKRAVKEKSPDTPPSKKAKSETEPGPSGLKRAHDSSEADSHISKRNKSEDSDKSKSSRRESKQPKSKDDSEVVTVATPVTQSVAPIEASSPPTKLNKKSRRQDGSSSSRSVRGGSGSRCTTPVSNNTSHHDSEDHGRTTPASSEEQLDFRVPINGEASYAYHSRQSTAATPTTSSTAEHHALIVPSASSSNIGSVDPENLRPAQPADSIDGQLQSGSRSGNGQYSSRAQSSPAQQYFPVQEAPFGRTRYGNVNLPADVYERYPSIAELEGRSLGDIFYTLFGTDVDRIAYANSQKFIDHAVCLKRKADGCTTARTSMLGTYYIEAVLYFVIAVQAMEADATGVSAAINMCTGTIDVVKWLSSLIKNNSYSSNHRHREYKAILEVLCLLCQSMLSMKVYLMKKDDLRLCTPHLEKHYTKMAKENAAAAAAAATAAAAAATAAAAAAAAAADRAAIAAATAATIAAAEAENPAANDAAAAGEPAGPGGPSNSGGTSSSNQAANSPSALSTPSPAESINSESSHSSGYNTSNERRPATPSTQELDKRELERHQLTYFSVTSYINSAHDCWVEAQRLIVTNNLQGFFGFLDRAVLPLSFHANSLELLVYIKAALREIDRTITRSNFYRGRGYPNPERSLPHHNDRNIASHSDRSAGSSQHSDRSAGSSQHSDRSAGSSQHSDRNTGSGPHSDRLRARDGSPSSSAAYAVTSALAAVVPGPPSDH